MPCFSSSKKFLFCWAPFCPSAYWRMPEMSRAFVHGHTFLHSWSGPMKLVVYLLQGATFLSNLTSAPFVPSQVLWHQNNTLSSLPKPLSIADLVWTTCKLPKPNPSASAKSRDVFGTGNFTATLLEPALVSNPTLSREVSATLAPCLYHQWQPAVTLMKERK